jgi:hypothetical protein
MGAMVLPDSRFTAVLLALLLWLACWLDCAPNCPLPSDPIPKDVCSGLSGAGGSGWPSNTLLYVGASPSSTVTPSDPLVQRAGLLLVTEELEEAGFRLAGTPIARMRSAARAREWCARAAGSKPWSWHATR